MSASHFVSVNLRNHRVFVLAHPLKSHYTITAHVLTLSIIIFFFSFLSRWHLVNKQGPEAMSSSLKKEGRYFYQEVEARSVNAIEGGFWQIALSLALRVSADNERTWGGCERGVRRGHKRVHIPEMAADCKTKLQVGKLLEQEKQRRQRNQ